MPSDCEAALNGGRLPSLANGGWAVLRPVFWPSVVLALVAVATPLDAIHPDATRDILIASDCALGHGCSAGGAPTSVAGILTGAAWTDLLAVARWFDIDLLWVAVGLKILIALSIGVCWCFARRERLAGADWIVPALLAFVSHTGPSVTLWAPMLALPLCILGVVGYLSALASEDWSKGALGAGFTLGLAASAHPAGVAAATIVGLDACAAGRWRLGLTIAAVGIGAWGLISPAAAAALLTAGVAQPQQIVVLALAMPLGLVLTRFAIRCHWRAESRLVLLAGMALLATGLAHQFSVRYAPMIAAPLALVVAGKLPAARGPAFLVALLAVFTAPSAGSPTQSRPTYRQARQAAIALKAAGVGWPCSLFAMRGRLGPELGEAAAIWLPPDLGQACAPTTVRVRNALDPPQLDVAGATRLQLQRATVCWRGDAAIDCRLLEPSAPSSNLPRLQDRSHPRPLAPPRAAMGVALVVPLTPGGEFTLEVFPAAGHDPCPWHIRGAGATARVAAGQTTLVLEKEFAAGCPPAGEVAAAVPALAEVASNPALPVAGVARPDEASPSRTQPGRVPVPTPEPAGLVLPPTAGAALARVFSDPSGRGGVFPDRPENVAVSATNVELTWSAGRKLRLVRSEVRPWFQVDRNSGLKPERAAELLRMLGEWLPSDPWTVAQTAPGPPPPAGPRAPSRVRVPTSLQGIVEHQRSAPATFLLLAAMLGAVAMAVGWTLRELARPRGAGPGQ